MTETQLSRLLAEPGSRPDAMAAFRLARREFLAERRLEMQELAGELGVSRATLFRWVGGRDQLLVEVIWSFTASMVRTATATAEGKKGASRLVSIMTTFASAAIEAPSFRRFLQREPERALRLLTTQAGPFQGRLVKAIERLLHEEIDSGHLQSPLPPHTLAYLVVRITETFVYADIIAGETPDPANVRLAVGALLRD